MYDFYSQRSLNHPSSASSSSRASSPLSDVSLSQHVPDYLPLGSQDTSYSHMDATYLPHHTTMADLPSHSTNESAHTFSRPLLPDEKDKLVTLDRLRLFLATAPLKWSSPSHDDFELGTSTQIPSPPKAPSSHPAMKRFSLPHPVGEQISCVLWSGRYYITGTDIVRALVFRFDAFGRPVKNMKKFEEGVFSDLRNLKPGMDASLEEPKSPFLDLLFKYQCIRTQKKQKVFFWQSVPHDRLFLDALERDLKREKSGLEPTSVVAGEPALSFTYDSQRSLYEQYSKNRNDSVDSSTGSDQRRSPADRDRDSPVPAAIAGQVSALPGVPGHSHGFVALPSGSSPSRAGHHHHQASSAAQNGIASSILQSYVFEGNPTYKQRRKRPTTATNHGHGLSKPFPGAAATGLSAGTGYEDGLGDRGEGASSAGSRSSFDMGMGYGPSDRSMTAADMFVSQARGEQDMNVRRTRERVMHAQRDAFAKAESLGYSGAQLVSSGPGSASGDDSSAHSRSSSAASMGGGVSKVYVCPVFQCGRLFRQPEFLQQHATRSHGTIPSHSNTSETSVASQQQQGDQLNLGLAAFASDPTLPHGVGAGSANGVYSDIAGDLRRNIEQHAVLVDGTLQDVLGDEEGVVTIMSDSRHPQRSATAPTSGVDYTAGYPMAGLLTGTQPDYAYGMGTSMGGMDMDMNMDGLSASGMPMPSAYETTSSSNGAPITGPSFVDEFHSTFDTRPATAGGSPSSAPTGAGGPARRHRSTTPSLMHTHGARAHQHQSSSPSPRGYHPYASTGHSRVSSSHSSPRGLGSGLSLSPTSLGFRPAMMPRALSVQPQAHSGAGAGAASGLPASFDGVFGTSSSGGFDVGSSLDFGVGATVGGFANASIASQAQSQMHSAMMDTSASSPPFALDDWPWSASPSYASAGIFSGVPS